MAFASALPDLTVLQQYTPTVVHHDLENFNPWLLLNTDSPVMMPNGVDISAFCYLLLSLQKPVNLGGLLTGLGCHEAVQSMQHNLHGIAWYGM